MKNFIDKVTGQSGTPINRSSMMAIQGFIGQTTVFGIDGNGNKQITETNSDGDTKVTVFSIVGGLDTITETFTSGTKIITKTTTFNADGSITEVIA